MMEVREGDVLVCQCDNCDVELTVTKACDECTDIKIECCGVEMTKKPS